MSEWTMGELSRIGNADLLEIASRRRDGTYSNPVTVWVVPHQDALYVRSWLGRTASWFRAAQRRGHGRIWAGGVEKDVTFEDADHDLDEAIDAVYREKYRGSGARYVDPMLSPAARSSTIKLLPSACA